MGLRRLQAAVTRAAAAAASGGSSSGSARSLSRLRTLARGQRLCHGGGGSGVEEKAKTGGKAAKEAAAAAAALGGKSGEAASASASASVEEEEGAGAGADGEEKSGQRRLTGLDLLTWSNQSEMFMPGLHKGALQAYAATAWLCAQSDEELGSGSRWTRLPIDEAARGQLEKYDGEKDPFNNASMLMKVADPEDRVTGMFLKEVLIEESGEMYARVIFQVDANPTALYGEDYEMAKSMATTLLRPQHEEMAKTLGLRLLNVAYSARMCVCLCGCLFFCFFLCFFFCRTTPHLSYFLSVSFFILEGGVWCCGRGIGDEDRVGGGGLMVAWPFGFFCCYCGLFCFVSLRALEYFFTFCVCGGGGFLSSVAVDPSPIFLSPPPLPFHHSACLQMNQRRLCRCIPALVGGVHTGSTRRRSKKRSVRALSASRVMRSLFRGQRCGSGFWYVFFILLLCSSCFSSYSRGGGSPPQKKICRRKSNQKNI